MNVKEAVTQRRSIRNFKPDRVKKEDIELILEAGRLAPSGTNLQPWRFIVIESAEMRERLKECTLNFVAEAPITIVCCADLDAPKYRKRRMIELHKAGAFEGTSFENINFSNYQGREMNEEELKRSLYFDTAIAIENMILQATELGLGSCWIGMFNRKKLKELLELDDKLEVVSLLAIGYSEKNPKQRPRLKLDQILIDWV